MLVFLLRLLFPFEGFSIYGRKFRLTFATYFLSLIFLNLLESSCFIFYSIFEGVFYTFYCYVWSKPQQKSYLWKLWDTNYKEKHGTTQAEMFNWSLLLYLVSQCPNFTSVSQNNKIHRNAKTHNAPKLDVTFKCELFYKEFPTFCALWQRKVTKHGCPKKTAIVDLDDSISAFDDTFLQVELWEVNIPSLILKLNGRAAKYSAMQ